MCVHAHVYTVRACTVYTCACACGRGLPPHLGQDLGVANDDHSILGLGESNVETASII